VKTFNQKTFRIHRFRLFNPVHSVGAKLFLIFFSCILALVLAVGFFSYSKSKAIIQDHAADATAQTILLASDKIEATLDIYEDISQQILSDPQFSKDLTAFNDPRTNARDKLALRKALLGKLSALAAGRQEISNISLVGVKDGVGLSVKGAADAKKNFLEEEWFQSIVQAGGTPVWLETRQLGYYAANEPSFALGRLLGSLFAGSQEDILLIEIKVSSLDNQLRILNTGDNHPVVILSDDNRMVRAGELQEIGEEYEVSLTPEQKNNARKSVASETQDGKLVVYKKMDVSGWTIAVAFPISELVKDAREIYRFTLIMAIVAGIVAALAGVVVIRMIGRPLVRLRNLMKEGERGDLTVRTDFRRKDEIGQVGLSFNQMMEQITKLIQRTNHSAAELLQTSGTLLQASVQTADSAKEIAVATEEIAKGASSLAEEAEKGNQMTQDVSLQIRRVFDANKEMESAVHEVEQVSERGTLYMSELVNKTNLAESLTRSMAEKVELLKESTSSISKILDMMNDITKQTNILSLNAAIEASRAGASGKGFMVVADEIRKLAEQSKKSIEVVSRITETIRSEIEETIKALFEANPVFQQQIASVKEADSIFNQIRSHMGSLSDSLGRVTRSVALLEQYQLTLSEAMNNVSAYSEESSAVSEEVATLTSEQARIGEGLVTMSENLRVLSLSLQEQLSKFKT